MARRSVRLLLVLLLLVVFSVPMTMQQSQRGADADWPTYSRDLAGTRYSPLNQINTQTVQSLQEAWSYRFHPDGELIEGPSPTELFQQVTPIVVDGVMYLAARVK